MLYVGLADKYGIPVSEFLRRWSSLEIAELVAFSGIREADAARDRPTAGKPAEQTPEQILAAIDRL